MIRCIAICFSMLFVFGQSFAQEEKNDFRDGLLFQPNVHFGKMVKNFPAFPEVDRAYFYELNVMRQTFGRKAWNKWYGYPEQGVSFIYGELGNKDVLGQSFSIMPYFAFHLLDHEKWDLEFKLGQGLTYFNNPYNAISNPDNLVVGSKFTSVFFAGLSIERKLTDHFGLKVGGSILHNSNGHITLPNVGVNVPLITVGVSIFPFGEPEIIDADAEVPENWENDAWKINVRLGWGIQEFGSFDRPTDGPIYPVYTASIYTSKIYSNISNLFLGMHFNYYVGHYDYIINQQLFQEKERARSFNAMVFVGHEHLLGHIGLDVQLGFNVYKPFQKALFESQFGELSTSQKLKVVNGNKIGLHYYLFKPRERKEWNCFASWMLKTNLTQADFVEFSLGYIF
jgi:hypothetical protein